MNFVYVDAKFVAVVVSTCSSNRVVGIAGPLLYDIALGFDNLGVAFNCLNLCAPPLVDDFESNVSFSSYKKNAELGAK